jgi:AcrR family transcriptional regulator
MSTAKRAPSIWMRPEPGGREQRLSRAKIAAAALAIADRDGIDAVSMRNIAAELDTGTMSLYHYVQNKAEILALMDDALLGEALLPSLPRDWRKALAAIARQTYAIFVRHPWSLVAMQGAPPGPNGMRHFEQCLEALAPTNLGDQQKLTLLALVDDFVFGHALRASETSGEIDREFAAAQLATGQFPRIAELFGNGPLAASETRFDEGLRALIDAAPVKTTSAKGAPLQKDAASPPAKTRPTKAKPAERDGSASAPAKTQSGKATSTQRAASAPTPTKATSGKATPGQRKRQLVVPLTSR